MQFQLSDFNKEKVIGEGQYGKIYKAKYLKYNQIVALKEIKDNEDVDPQVQRNYLKREIDIMDDILRTQDYHPNIMKYYGNFEENNKAYLVLEYVEGENLLEFSKRYSTNNTFLSQNLIIIILKGIINGLMYLCGKNILHRDITLNNIMIDNKYNIKITDFGISAFFKLNNNQNNQKQELKQSVKYTVVGKPEYLSPELFKAYSENVGKTKYDFKADIYSLGVTMFYLMTFKFPYKINDNKERIRTKAFIDPNRYDPQLINIIMRMLEENQYIRPSCIDIYGDLCKIFGENVMKVNYQINMNNDDDINLKANYIIKKSAFFSAIYSLYNISEFRKYFEINTTKETVKMLEQKSPESTIVIGSFIDAINKLKSKGVKNKMEGIVNFIENSSTKIITFKEYNKITPQLIIENLFDYFYYNITDMFVYNNKIAFEISGIIEKDENISPIIKQKVDEFKNNYSNIFADIFYFIILTKKICPNCHFLIEEEADIEYELECPGPGHIKQLFDDFENERNYSNLGKKGKVCKKCKIMPINLIIKRSIFSAPNVLILHFGNDNVDEIELNIEIKESLNSNKTIKYILFSVIIKKEFNNNYRYNIAVYQNNIESWIYYTDDDSTALSFIELLDKGNICTAFYQKVE